MEMRELGQQLREAREAKGLSLKKIQEETRISLSFIQAMEEGDMDQLPHPVYAKSFLQNYAKYLGLDWKKMGEEFSRNFDKDEYEQMKKLPTSLKSGPRDVLVSHGAKASVLGLALIVVFGMGWLVYSFFWMDRGMDAENEFIVTEERTVGVEPDQEPRTGDFPVFIPAFPLAESQVNVDDNEDEVDIEDVQIKVTDAGLEHFMSEEAPVEDIEPALGTVFIQAHEDCWLMVRADDDTKEHFLRPGDSLNVHYKKSLRLLLGNAGGVDITVNGQPYLLEASSGEVKSVEFTLPGAEQE